VRLGDRCFLIPDRFGPVIAPVKTPAPAEIEQYQKGIRLSLSVKDLAVRLALCDEHAQELTAAWAPVLTKLAEWGWRPLRGMTS